MLRSLVAAVLRTVADRLHPVAIDVALVERLQRLAVDAVVESAPAQPETQAATGDQVTAASILPCAACNGVVRAADFGALSHPTYAAHLGFCGIGPAYMTTSGSRLCLWHARVMGTEVISDAHA